jgi:hypothetical protein
MRASAAGLDRRDVGLAILCAALALWSYRWALGSYFSPDDLIYLERARGLVPEPDRLWRVVSGPLWFSLLVPVFQSNALAYLGINWLLNAINVALLYAFVRRAGGTMLAATIAACLFASSRLFLSVVGQAVGNDGLLALLLVLLAAHSLIRHQAAHRWIAPVAFALALLSKEYVIALPPAFLLLPAVGRGVRERLIRVGPLILASVLWGIYLIASESSTRVFGGTAYQTSYGMQILRNLGTYVGWVVDFVKPAPDFTRPAGDVALIAGVAGLAIVAVLAWLVRRGAPLVPFGVAWFVLGIAPVLPLVNQHHQHYLYAPFAGIAISVAAALVAVWELVKRRGAPGRADLLWKAIVVLVIAHVAVSDHLMSKRVRDQLWEENVPYDPFVRKVELIRRMSRRVAPLASVPGSRLVIIVPRIDDRLAELLRGLLPGVVDQGRGLRALYPNLDSVAFVDRWTPAYRDFELVAGSVDGMIVAFGSGPDAHLRYAGVLVDNEFVEEALQHLGDAIPAYPGDPRLLLAERTLRARVALTAQPMPQSSSRPSSPPIR